MNDAIAPDRPGSQTADADQILDTAMAMADELNNWYDLSLERLAERCNLPVNRLRRHYADTNAIANAWFGRGLEAMLAPPAKTLESLPARQRLQAVIWRWFESLSPYRQVSAQMLGAKLHPPHVHHWLPMLFDLSRLVQLWRDAAGLHAGGRRRQLEEIALTGIFLETLRCWCSDDTPQQQRTHRHLKQLLKQAERVANLCFSNKAA